MFNEDGYLTMGFNAIKCAEREEALKKDYRKKVIKEIEECPMFRINKNRRHSRECPHCRDSTMMATTFDHFFYYSVCDECEYVIKSRWKSPNQFKFIVGEHVESQDIDYEVKE